MPVLYGPFQSVLKDKNGKQLFYPRVLRTGNVSTSQISKEIAAYSSLSPGDVKNTLDNLVTVVSQHLQNMYLQPIITQYFIDNKSEIWLLFLIAHSKR